MDNTAVSVRDVTKAFGEQEVLKNVSVEFPKGGIYGLIGRNGSGKTVLLKCICGFVPPTSGEITVWDKRVGQDVDFPNDLGFIIESPGFLPAVSGLKNLKYLASIRNKISEKRIRECISLVGLDPDSKKPVGKYSMGMRQRLGIAQAIMENPELIVLDEPMNGLDNHGVDEMRTLFLDLKEEGKTILLTSHNREDIQLLCDSVYEMEAGELREAVL
ncbi:MAG: ATP-binding cassette domain-containing protein [Clostridiales bacterium]|nr:ATP-binding cassette domain-containing protein [Clostridiales bacterium]